MAVSDAAREVIIRVADNGTVREISSLKPCGFANLPPHMKNSIASISTQIASDIVIASAMPCAPLMKVTSPPANTTESIILTTSSSSSVDENAKKFFLPQNQLLKDA